MSEEAAGLKAVLNASGPTVQCVLLRHMRKSGRDAHPHMAVVESPPQAAAAAASALSPTTTTTKKTSSKEVLVELIEQIPVDTTPNAHGVEQALGGPFTFLGQYPEEGVVLVARGDQVADLESIDHMSVKELRDLYRPKEGEAMPLEKQDLIASIREMQLPINPHELQPPFHDIVIRGDILLMRVGGEEEEDDEDGDEDGEAAMAKAMSDFSKASSVPNEEFFLDYTKDEYVMFASRTDILPSKEEEEVSDGESSGDRKEDDGDEEEEEDDEDKDEDFVPGGEDVDDQEKSALLNMALADALRRFREIQGRGPNSEELLELRRQIAEAFGIHLEQPKPLSPDGKRKAETDKSPDSLSKRVKFADDETEPAALDDETKPAAKEGTRDNGKDVQE